MLMRHYENV